MRDTLFEYLQKRQKLQTITSTEKRVMEFYLQTYLLLEYFDIAVAYCQTEKIQAEVEQKYPSWSGYENYSWYSYNYESFGNALYSYLNASTAIIEFLVEYGYTLKDIETELKNFNRDVGIKKVLSDRHDAVHQYGKWRVDIAPELSTQDWKSAETKIVSLISTAKDKAHSFHTKMINAIATQFQSEEKIESQAQEEQIKTKCTNIIKDRVDGVYNDLKAFIYIRSKGLQHNIRETGDNIGGGNIVVGLSLFSVLNFLGKAYYCTVSPNKFERDGRSKNETDVFIHFIEFLKENSVDFGLPDNQQDLQAIWSGFRNYLAHRLAPESGKSILTFIFEPKEKGTIPEILAEAKKHKVFQKNPVSNDWQINGDSLLAYVDDITKMTILCIASKKDIDTKLLLKVIGIEYP